MKHLRLWWGTLVVYFLFGMSLAWANALHTDCEAIVSDDVETIQCQVRSKNGKSVSDVRPQVTDNSDVDFKVDRYTWATNKSAWYFLVQQAGLTREQKNRVGEFLVRAAFPAGKNANGIATTTDQFTELAALGSNRYKLNRTALDIRNSETSADKPDLQKALRESVSALEEIKADRKALVLILNSDSEDDTYRTSDVIDRANDAKVAIYVLVFGSKRDGVSNRLAKLATDTNGAAYDLSNLELNETLEFAPKLLRHLENGYVLKLKTRGLPQSSKFKISADVEGRGTLFSNSIKIDRLTKDPWQVRFASDIKRNLTAYIAMFVLALGFFLIAATRLLPSIAQSGRLPPAVQQKIESLTGTLGFGKPSNDEATHIITSGGNDEEQATAAWLQLLESDEAPVPLHPGSARIGRHQKNDIRLTNKSVHRQHAILQMTPEGAFTIQDLGTKNGVYVNGKRQNQHELTDGDTIELGEVKLRFIKNPD